MPARLAQCVAENQRGAPCQSATTSSEPACEPIRLLMPRQTSQKLTPRVLLLFLFLFPTGRVAAQTAGASDLRGDNSYSYAVFLGTGFYKFDDRRLFLLRIPVSWQLRELKPDQMGIKLLLPVAVGIQNFDKLDDIPGLDIDDVQTISFVPGVELQFLPLPRWEVKPFFQGGVGWDPDAGTADFIYGLGARTNYIIPRGNAEIKVGGEYLLAGDKADDGGSSNINRVSLGIEYKHPIRWSLFNRQTSMHWRLIGYNYIGGFTVKSFPDTESYEIDSELEIGFALSIDPVLKILGIPASHLGLGYRIGEHSRAIVVETTFPF